MAERKTLVGVIFRHRTGTTFLQSVLKAAEGVWVEGHYPWEGVIWSSCVEIAWQASTERPYTEVRDLQWVRFGVWPGAISRISMEQRVGLDPRRIYEMLWKMAGDALPGRMVGEKVGLRQLWQVHRWELPECRWILPVRSLVDNVTSVLAFNDLTPANAEPPINGLLKERLKELRVAVTLLKDHLHDREKLLVMPYPKIKSGEAAQMISDWLGVKLGPLPAIPGAHRREGKPHYEQLRQMVRDRLKVLGLERWERVIGEVLEGGTLEPLLLDKVEDPTRSKAWLLGLRGCPICGTPHPHRPVPGQPGGNQ